MSVGTDYRSAARARSRAEFVAKLGIANEEADEAVYWLEFLRNTNLGTAATIDPLLQFDHHINTSRDHHMQTLEITWLGHSSFHLRTPGGVDILFDPWYTGNPRFPESARPAKADLILVSHGHSDHITDAAAMAKATGATVVGSWEVVSWLGTKGVQAVEPMNKGGSITVKGLRITMTEALHSSSVEDGGAIVYLGEPAGFVVRLENGQAIYFAGDTALFSDMKLIGELYKPDIAFLPIGDRFTMGPDTAAMAARFLGVKQVVPMHWGTFPLLTGTPEALKEHLAGSGIEVLELQPGETAK